MTALDRMLAALSFQQPDRVPVLLNNTFNASRLIHATVREVTQEPDILAAALLESYRTLGCDGLRVGTDVCVEAEAMGCQVNYPEDDVAFISRHILREQQDLHRLKMPDPRKDGRMPLMCKATRMVAEQVRDEVFLYSLAMGPVNLASQLMGVSELLMWMMDDGEFVHRLLELCAEVTVSYGKELAANGAHGIVMGEAICSVSMLGPRLYREFALPWHKVVVAELKRCGIAHTAFHICGDLEPILVDVASTGVGAIDVDSPVDMGAGRDMLGKKAAFIGNISPSLLLTGTQEEVLAACEQVLAAKHGLGMVLGAGCTIARDTPIENLEVMVQSAATAGRYEAR